jgi:hypothetical protein
MNTLLANPVDAKILTTTLVPKPISKFHVVAMSNMVQESNCTVHGHWCDSGAEVVQAVTSSLKRASTSLSHSIKEASTTINQSIQPGNTHPIYTLPYLHSARLEHHHTQRLNTTAKPPTTTLATHNATDTHPHQLPHKTHPNHRPRSRRLNTSNSRPQPTTHTHDSRLHPRNTNSFNNIQPTTPPTRRTPNSLNTQRIPTHTNRIKRSTTPSTRSRTRIRKRRKRRLHSNTYNIRNASLRASTTNVHPTTYRHATSRSVDNKFYNGVEARSDHVEPGSSGSCAVTISGRAYRWCCGGRRRETESGASPGVCTGA